MVLGRDDGPEDEVCSSLPGELLAPALKAKLMERIRTEERLRHRRRGHGRRSIGWGVALVAAVLAVAWAC